MINGHTTDTGIQEMHTKFSLGNLMKRSHIVKCMGNNIKFGLIQGHEFD
jgi:hypothetical protein